MTKLREKLKSNFPSLQPAATRRLEESQSILDSGVEQAIFYLKRKVQESRMGKNFATLRGDYARLHRNESADS